MLTDKTVFHPTADYVWIYSLAQSFSGAEAEYFSTTAAEANRTEGGEAQETGTDKSFSLSHFIITLNLLMGNYQANFN